MDTSAVQKYVGDFFYNITWVVVKDVRVSGKVLKITHMRHVESSQCRFDIHCTKLRVSCSWRFSILISLCHLLRIPLESRHWCCLPQHIWLLKIRSNNRYRVDLEADGYGVLNFESGEIETDFEAGSAGLPSVCEYVVTGNVEAVYQNLFVVLFWSHQFF